MILNYQVLYYTTILDYNIARQLNTMNYIIVRETDYLRNLLSIQVLRREWDIEKLYF